jgi:hypothetical protein
MSKIQVYYWPMLLRGASLVRMLEHTSTPYEYISAKPQMAELVSMASSDHPPRRHRVC